MAFSLKSTLLLNFSALSNVWS